MTTVYPPGEVTRHGRTMLLDGMIPKITYTAADRSRIFHLQGGESPMLGVQDGIVLQSISGMSPGFKHLDSQGAREDGVTWNDTVYEPMEIDTILEAGASTPAGLSRVVSDWIASNSPRTPGRLEYFTPEMGLWWGQARLADSWSDQIKAEPRMRLKRILTQTWRIDHAFWHGVDSISTFQHGGTGGSGHVQLANIGQVDGWPSFLIYGPGYFELGNGPSSSDMIKFGSNTTSGKLVAGQIVLITTLPRLRSVVDLTPGLPAPQQLVGLQKLIDVLVKLITFNQVPPLLTWFESLFGIRPPQGVLYSLLEGRFSRPITGVMQPDDAQSQAIAVKISCGNADSKIIASVTPRRVWPE